MCVVSHDRIKELRGRKGDQRVTWRGRGMLERDELTVVACLVANLLVKAWKVGLW